MRLIRALIAGIIVCLYTGGATAQIDPHFSQYYANPLWLNPALTGVVDGDYRTSVSAKQQWASISNAYVTAGASFDMAPVKHLAFGATILNQSAGDLDFNYLNALVSGAYRVRFGKEGLNIINFSLQAGVLNRSFDASKLRTGDQYDPINGYDGNLPSGESFASGSSIVPDVNTGVMYFDGNPDRRINTFAGLSAYHLTRPEDKFLGGDYRIPIRFTTHGGARIKVSDVLDVIPNGIYLQQGNAKEIAAGAYAQLMLNSESNILFGSTYRLDDAAIGFIGLHIKNMVFGLSYDMNTSSLQRTTNGNGGFEISVSYTSRKGIIGPNFFYPRL